MPQNEIVNLRATLVLSGNNLGRNASASPRRLQSNVIQMSIAP